MLSSVLTLCLHADSVHLDPWEHGETQRNLTWRMTRKAHRDGGGNGVGVPKDTPESLCLLANTHDYDLYEPRLGGGGGGGGGEEEEEEEEEEKMAVAGEGGQKDHEEYCHTQGEGEEGMEPLMTLR